jgi:hypothetical protein
VSIANTSARLVAAAQGRALTSARNGKPLMYRNATGRGFELAAKKAGIEA